MSEISENFGSDDTIAAIATASGPSGVGVVRISGPNAREILEESIGRSDVPERRVIVGEFKGLEADPIDKVVGFWMQGPRSYTGEDVAEVQGHGGDGNMSLLLGAVLSRGARLATAGEFTRRALCNGKLSLSQAEAVMGVVKAESEMAARSMQRALLGDSKTLWENLLDDGKSILAEIEAELDFPEDDVDAEKEKDWRLGLASLQRRCESTLKNHHQTKLLNEGLVVALVGRTNAGKSSLFNKLVGYERVLVSSTAGTTRDVVELRTVWKGVPVLLLDTAGRTVSPSNDVEQAGISYGEKRADSADIRIAVSEDGQDFEDDDAIRVISKSDQETERKSYLAEETDSICTSADTGFGIESLKTRVLAKAGYCSDAKFSSSEGVLASERQRQELMHASEALNHAQKELGKDKGLQLELVAADMNSFVAHVSSLLGVDPVDSMLDSLFKNFCIGK